MYQPNDRIAQVEVLPCFGEVELQLFRSPTELASGVFYERVASLQGGRLVYRHESEAPGPLFLKVSLQGNWDKSRVFAHYRLRFNLLYPNQPELVF